MKEKVIFNWSSSKDSALCLYKTLQTEQVMSQGGIKAMAVFEFPGQQSIKDMLASEEFNALNDLRKKVYKQEVDLMICEAL